MHTAVLISSGNDIHKWIFYDVNLFTMGSRIQNCPIYEVTGLHCLFCFAIYKFDKILEKLKSRFWKKNILCEAEVVSITDNLRHFKSKQVSQKLKEIKKTCKNKSTTLFDNSSFSTTYVKDSLY